ncbi:MAG: MOSC domain-containing protein YiiM, partial [Halioglobus sp.]
GHGGLCARILRTGNIAVGDQLELRPEGENLNLF